MDLLDILGRKPPAPWQDGDNIPWHDPAFSKRMLREHLAQHHDAASRRFEVIDAHADWIHQHVLGASASRVLDLGCGPGLYTSRLAKMGHQCTGIDYSPASVEYARAQAQAGALPCEYTCQDVRLAALSDGHGLVMLISGELNVFRAADATSILENARRALNDGGRLLLEVHTEESIRDIGLRGLRWYSADRGVFSDKPHLCLQEHRWDGDGRTATVRYFVVDAEDGRVERHAQTYQAYSRDEYRSLLEAAGFADLEWYPSLTGEADESQKAFEVVVAPCATA